MADKKISELNTALTIADSDDFAVVQAAETKQVSASVIKTYIGTAPTISGGTIDNAVIGGSTAVAGAFTSLTSSSTTTLNGTTIPASKTLLVSTDIGSSVQAYDSTILNDADIGVNVQAYSANLDEYAAVNPTAAGLALLDDVDAAAQRSTLGLVIGTDVQAYDSDLTAWAGKTAPTGDAVGTSDSQTLTNKTISGSSNTLSNIGNSSLTNSSITFGSTATSLGGTVSALNGVSIGASTASTGAFTTLSASSTVSGSGFSTYLASPPAIGGTTPAAGNFTTLGATGNVTLGDASGDTVTLNAATVTLNNSTSITATSGNSLTLNGGAGSNGLVLNSSNNVGIGTSSPGVASGYTTLDVNNATNGARIRCLVNGTAYGGMYTNGTTDFRIGSLAAVPLNIITGSNTIATFDASGNLGIGTSSPGAKLDLYLGRAKFTANSEKYGIELKYNAATNGCFIGSPESDGFCISTAGGAERMRLDSSGNLGLGVTPSNAYTAGGMTAVQVKAAVMLGRNLTSWAQWGANTYNDSSGTQRYIYSDYASFYQQYQGAHSWFTAPLGTAGNGIGATQAMTLDAGGRLLVGTTTQYSGFKVQVVNNDGFAVQNAAANGIAAYFGAASNVAFTASGDYAVLVGSSGILLGTGTAGSATERARITSSGNLLVGNTVINPVGSRSNGTSVYPGGVIDIRGNPNASVWGMNATSGDFIRFYTDNGSANVYCGSLVGSGNTFSIYSVSDQRLKTNIQPAGSAIESILNFPVDQFDWISTGAHQDFGAVAQKAINFIPEMVSVPADEDEMWGIDWSKAVPRLIKTIQELHAEIESLKAKVN